jgi:hypothetical protein
MGGDKMEMAKDAAKAAVELLGPKDKVGVIAFEGETYWIQEIVPGSNKNQVIEKISAIEAGGGTVMGPALEAAYEALVGTNAKLKHVIALTDGISEPADWDNIVANMVQAKITVSTVGVSQGGADEIDAKLLETISKQGNGRYYYCDDPNSLPQIFAKETVTASKSALNEQPFIPQVLRPTHVLSEIDIANSPFLLGYVTTRPKATSELILVSEKGDPLLAWWRYGLGMSVAFTSDAKSRWAAEWVSWPGYGKFWAQIIRHAMRKSDAKGVFVDVKQKDRKASITLDAVMLTERGQGGYLNGADTELTVIGPTGKEQKVAMTQTAPGRYTGEFPTDTAGTYHLQMTQKLNGATLGQQSRGLVVNYDDELRLRPTDEKLLESIASVSGGTFKPEPDAIFNPPERTASRAVPLWPYLLIAALLIFVVDVALRRIDFALLLGRTRPIPGTIGKSKATPKPGVNGHPSARSVARA